MSGFGGGAGAGGGAGVSIARARGENRFYNPPAIRQRQLAQQMQREKEQQNQPKPSEAVAAAAEVVAAVPETPSVSPSLASSADSDERTAVSASASEDCASSFCSVSARGANCDSTNLDRFLEYTTPRIPAQYKSLKQWRTREPELNSYYVLDDLWESYKEWSAYGAGVPLLLNGSDSVMQYYVPYLSGIQLYVDPSKPSPRLRKPEDESDAESSRETSSDGSGDYGQERGPTNLIHGSWSRKNTIEPINGWKGPLCNGKMSMDSSSDESETGNSPGHLIFEYLERDLPYNREPLADKISVLASQFPELRTYRSCDLTNSSWISVAWYPIYRIPTGPTLQNLEACFLTFHILSTPSQGTSTDCVHMNSERPREFQRANPKLSLPIFGLASYKFKVSFWNPDGANECQKPSSLLQVADKWLRRLRVDHPDYSFFVSHHGPRR